MFKSKIFFFILLTLLALRFDGVVVFCGKKKEQGVSLDFYWMFNKIRKTYLHKFNYKGLTDIN